MENKPNRSNKSQKNHNKESFYVILFVCLCLVAAIATITISSKNRVAKNPASTNEQLASEISDTQKEPDNALLVKNSTNDVENIANETKEENTMTIEIPTSATEVINSNKEENSDLAVAVSKTSDMSFDNPVEGTLGRAYATIPVFYDTFSDEKNITYKSNLGIDIKAELGAPVFASADGTVEYIGNNKKNYGMCIVIDHGNGFKSVYANLDNEVKVKENDKVKKGDEIGKVGNTTLKSAYEKYGSHLHFAVLEGNGTYEQLSKNNDFVDPAKYVHYKKEVEDKSEETFENESEETLDSKDE